MSSNKHFETGGGIGAKTREAGMKNSLCGQCLSKIEVCGIFRNAANKLANKRAISKAPRPQTIICISHVILTHGITKLTQLA